MKKELILVLALMLSVGFVSAAVTECIDEFGNPQAGPGAYPAYNDTGVVTNVAAGNICVDAANYDVDPDASYNCALWSDCVADACSQDEYYVGYSGDGSSDCVDTDWVYEGTYNVSDDYIIDTTEHVDTCSLANTGKTATYDACLNLYTRQGPDGYCDGAGALDTNDATLHVTVGNVCSAGTNINPNSTLNCGTWYGCILDAHTADSYYVGYAGSGTSCDATDWVATGSTMDYGLRRILVTANASSCSLGGYGGNNYVKSDLQPIVIDMLGTGGAEIVYWSDLAVLAVVLLFGSGIVFVLYNKYK